MHRKVTGRDAGDKGTLSCGGSGGSSTAPVPSGMSADANNAPHMRPVQVVNGGSARTKFHRATAALRTPGPDLQPPANPPPN
jgi:hypothetical protein